MRVVKASLVTPGHQISTQSKKKCAHVSVGVRISVCVVLYASVRAGACVCVCVCTYVYVHDYKATNTGFCFFAGIFCVSVLQYSQTEWYCGRSIDAVLESFKLSKPNS